MQYTLFSKHRFLQVFRKEEQVEGYCFQICILQRVFLLAYLRLAFPFVMCDA